MTPKADIKLLLSDVDGTLVTHDKVLTLAAVQAARDLRRADIGLSLVSARPPTGLRMLTGPLELDLPFAGFNGGLILDPDFKVLERHPIAPDAARTAIEALAADGLDVWLYTEDAWFVADAVGPHVAREAWILKTEPHSTPRFELHYLSDALKIVGVSDDHPRVAAAQTRLQAQLAGAASVTSSAPYFVDVTHPLANKGAVVLSLAKRLGLPPAQIATIGDGANDVLMFRQSGLSIAMGQASEAVKAEAGAVTDNNEADGFAKAVRKFILRRDAA